MQMNGNAELITISDSWKDWADPRMVIVVLNNRDLNQVTWEERVQEGDPKFDAAQHVPDFPYARYAEMVGLKGILVNQPEQIGAAFDAAFAADRPCVIEAITDPEVPPLPPHITLKQAKAFAESMLKGDTGTPAIIKESAREMMASIFPGRKGG
jgi:pyruvate dehydrogenase (quinone)